MTHTNPLAVIDREEHYVAVPASDEHRRQARPVVGTVHRERDDAAGRARRPLIAVAVVVALLSAFGAGYGVGHAASATTTPVQGFGPGGPGGAGGQDGQRGPGGRGGAGGRGGPRGSRALGAPPTAAPSTDGSALPDAAGVPDPATTIDPVDLIPA